MKRSLFTILLLLAYLDTFSQYMQVGGKIYPVDITGDGTKGFGYSTSLSADGMIALIGSPYDHTQAGAIWAYTINGGYFVRLGDKLSSDSKSFLGSSVCLSSDGKTALAGGFKYNTGTGVAMVYTLTGNNFVQVGNKLIGSDTVGKSNIGTSVSVSADGKTVLLGGPLDNSGVGAAWIFTFDGTNYVQAGNKLVGTGAIGNANQGHSVSLSADAKTAVIGGYKDDTNKGAIWIFTFNGSNYVQAGNKIVGTGALGPAWQGYALSISADSKTITVGGPNDDANYGAIWVYTFNGSSFVQFGAKLKGTTGSASPPNQGYSTGISADGKRIITGGIWDDPGGAVWIYKFNGTNFVQTGSKLVGTDAAGFSFQGSAVSLSADGKNALIGGIADASYYGAMWVYTDTSRCIYSNPAPVLSYNISNDTLYLSITDTSHISEYHWNVSGNVFGNISSLKYALKPGDIQKDSIHVHLVVFDSQPCSDTINKTLRISEPTNSISNQNEALLIKIYPNPFSSAVFIQTDIPGTYTIYNTLGQTIFNTYISKSVEVNLEKLQQGTYFYQFLSDRLVKKGKLIKK